MQQIITLKIIVSGDKIEYFILLNSKGCKSSGPAERLFLSLFIAAKTTFSLMLIESSTDIT